MLKDNTITAINVAVGAAAILFMASVGARAAEPVVPAAEPAAVAAPVVLAPGCSYEAPLGFRDAKGQVKLTNAFIKFEEGQAKRLLPLKSKDATVRVTGVAPRDEEGVKRGDVTVYLDFTDGDVKGEAVLLATSCGPMVRTGVTFWGIEATSVPAATERQFGTPQDPGPKTDKPIS
jgi:hypothetical protein